MPTRDEALNQWKQSVQGFSGKEATADELNDFSNRWNQSAEAGLYSGPGYGKSWDEMFREGEDYNRRRYAPNEPSQPQQAQQSSYGGGSAQQGSSESLFPQWYQGMMERQMGMQEKQAAENKGRADSLYGTLMGRANQGLNVNRNDPVIRAQADAYSANVERNRRNYLSDVAERSGPLSNLRGEQRMAAEKAGQATGGFEADLMGRELTARRQEIANALSGMGGMLSGDQAAQLQRELARMDQAIKEAGTGISSRSVGNQYDLGLRNLGLNDWDRQMYWDALSSGRLG